MKKRLISMLLVFCMIFSLLPVQALAVGTEKQTETSIANPFTDIHTGDWYYDGVQYVYRNGIFNGTSKTTFWPHGTMTRGMFVTVLGRMAGVNAEDYVGPSSFTDVEGNAWYAPFVNWAAKHGITSGTGGGKFSPDAYIDRQQMAALFVNYFKAFDVDYTTGANITSVPGDLDSITPWAKDAVLTLWKEGLLNGDGKNFMPVNNAARAEAAVLCMRFDDAVKVWYSEPGVPSERVPVGSEPPDPTPTPKPGGSGGSNTYSVRFYDGSRLVDTLYARKGKPLGAVPTTAKTSRADAVFEGWYVDREFTTPFYADAPVTNNMSAYAKYTELPAPELNITSFAQKDLKPDASFIVVSMLEVPAPSPEPAPGEGEDSGETEGPVDPGFTIDERVVALLGSITLKPKDGSAPVELVFDAGEDNTCVISAVGGFKEGSSYELTLPEGLNFQNSAGETMPDTVRTASFTIEKAPVANLRMSDEIHYIQKPDVSYNDLNGGSFIYGGSNLRPGDIICFYKNTDPRVRDYVSGTVSYMNDPEVYVKVKSVSGDTVTYKALDTNEDSNAMYDVPDNFPILYPAGDLATLPTGEDTGTLTLKADDDNFTLDANAYMLMMGAEEGTPENADTKVGKGDFISIYVSQESIDSEDDVYFGQITAYDSATGEITYQKCSVEDIEKSMDLYVQPVISGDDIVSTEAKKEIEEVVSRQIEESGFAEEAVLLLADAATKTDGFRNMERVQDILFTDESGEVLSKEEIARMDVSRAFQLDPVKVSVNVITSGDQLHFENGSVQLLVTVQANFLLPTGLDEAVQINVSANFIQEVGLGVTANGELVRKKILGFIPVPIGVKVGAAVDIESFTGIDVDAQVITTQMGNIDMTDISGELKAMMTGASNPNLDMEVYAENLSGLMTKYSEMLEQETDWVQLVDEEIVKTEFVVYGLAIGVSADFVVRADVNIAMGASLSYQVGKRYSFWFQIGLFKPSAGSSTMDLVDEQFAFQFYVMGKLGLKMGVRGAVSLGIGSTSVASVGLALELGPYVKLYGFFIYECERTRPANTSQWVNSQNMAGALYMDFGLYLIVAFEAQALGLFEYTHDFVNAEFPLLSAGEEKYPYGFQYQPPEDDMVRVVDDDLTTPVVTMKLPEAFRAVAYCNLTTGALSSQVFDYDHYNISLSNPAFSFEPGTGIISVDVPENTRFLSCDMTLTYKYGKLAFSPCDLQVTIPLVWTNMPEEELNQLYTASVRVGNTTDGYEVVWSKRVHKGEEFTLPTEAELKKRIAFNEMKYKDTFAYPDAGATKTIISDALYDCTVDYKKYTITVNGVQNEDGTTRSQSFITQYGKPFDFSSLKQTGTDNHATRKFTKFAGVTTKAVINDEVIDLNQPVSGTFAKMLDNGTVTAAAEYTDDSVLATYHFVGLTVEDGKDRIRKGTASYYDFNTVALNNHAMVTSVTPALGKLNASTDYFLDCKPLSGTYSIHTIHFDANGGESADAITQVGGSLLPNLPEAKRTGYTFQDWYTDKELTTEFEGTHMSDEKDITLYAKWEPNKYQINFQVEAGGMVDETTRTVTYDQYYGGADTSSLKALPKPKLPGYGFRGWHTARVGGTEIKADDIVKITKNTTLYAHWEPLKPIPTEMFRYETNFTGIYTGSAFTLEAPTQVKEFGDLTFADFKLKYERQADQYYSITKSYNSLTNAGTYSVVICREEDDVYEAYEQVCPNVAIIRRAASGPAGNVYLKGTDPGFNFLTIEASNYESAMGEIASFTYYASEMDGGTEVSNSYGTDTLHNLRPNTQYYVKAEVANHLNYEEAWTNYQLVTQRTSVIGTGTPGKDTSIPTSGKEIHISTPNQLYAISHNVLVNGVVIYKNSTIILDNDIDFYECYQGRDLSGWAPIGDANRPFEGTFDGNGHTIRGLSATGDYAGLFGYVKGATIRNVKVEDSYFEGTVAAGAVVGQAVNSTVSNCHNVHTTVVGPSGGAKTVVGIGENSGCTTSGKVYYK